MNTATAAAAAAAATAGAELSSATPAANSPSQRTACSHSIGRRLSAKLALLTVLVLGLLSGGLYWSVHSLIKERNAEAAMRYCKLLSALLEAESRSGGLPAVEQRLLAGAAMRNESHVALIAPDNRTLYTDALSTNMRQSEHVQAHDLAFDMPAIGQGAFKLRITTDYSADARMGQRWAGLLILTTLLAGTAVALGARWQVRRAMKPLNDLASQTQAISPQRLDQRLALSDPAEELHPLIEQFNALMQRLERAYEQLEAFNADVAHELRTPLAALIGHTELALSRERGAPELAETLSGNLEELQRLSSLVNDMLFLASADRGARARRGEALSLAELARDVVEFHEAPLEDAGLTIRVEGDCPVAVDEPLVKRALSNLVGNATRYAESGSTVVVRISQLSAREVRLEVENTGAAIEPESLPRIFDRFFRADSSRQCGTVASHHGLGLAIVAAISRMHDGAPWAHSEQRCTRIGFTLAM
jgi:two-component system, OmpR family, heavy metal sensor histidine kinase CusS